MNVNFDKITLNPTYKKMTKENKDLLWQTILVGLKYLNNNTKKCYVQQFYTNVKKLNMRG